MHSGCLFKKPLCILVLVSFCCSLKKEESQKKKLQEINNQKAHDRIEELEKAKERLEQEMWVSRTRLQVEAVAARQVSCSAARPAVSGKRSGSCS